MTTPIVKEGVLAGASTIFLYLIAYFIDKSLFFHPGLHWATMMLYVFFMWRGLQHSMKTEAAEESWRRQLKAPFGIFLLANLIFWTFYFLMFTFDAEMAIANKARQLADFESTRGLFNSLTDEKQLDNMKQLLESGDGSVSLGQVLMSYIRAALGGFLLSVILVFVARRTR